MDCHSRYFDTGKKASGHIPFRDRASQSSMRRPADKEAVVSQDEPEEEPIVETQRDSGEALPELPLLDEEEEEDDDARDDAGDPLADEESPDPVVIAPESRQRGSLDLPTLLLRGPCASRFCRYGRKYIKPPTHPGLPTAAPPLPNTRGHSVSDNPTPAV